MNSVNFVSATRKQLTGKVNSFRWNHSIYGLRTFLWKSVQKGFNNTKKLRMKEENLLAAFILYFVGVYVNFFKNMPKICNKMLALS